MRRAVAGGAGGGRSDAATASHLNAATFPESKEPRVQCRLVNTTACTDNDGGGFV